MVVLVLESVRASKNRARGRGTRDEDELAWQVLGPDARPILEVEAFHEPKGGASSPLRADSCNDAFL